MYNRQDSTSQPFHKKTIHQLLRRARVLSQRLFYNFVDDISGPGRFWCVSDLSANPGPSKTRRRHHGGVSGPECPSSKGPWLYRDINYATFSLRAQIILRESVSYLSSGRHIIFHASMPHFRREDTLFCARLCRISSS